MALTPALLQTALLAIFNAMNTITSDGDRYFADEAAAAVKAFILAGQVATTDSGSVPAGAYTGAGVGSMTIDDGPLADSLFSTFTSGYGDDDLADHIAADIDSACTKENTVTTASTGTASGSNGPVPFACAGKGKFSGTKSSLANSLKSCFSAMSGMTSGGNEYFAEQFSAAINAWLQAGSVSVQLQSPASGSGSGKIT
jgi:hypothetical protein